MPPPENRVTLPGLYDQAAALWSEFRIVKEVARELALSHARGDLDNDDYLTAVANLRAAVRERTAPLIVNLIASVEAYAEDAGMDSAIEESVHPGWSVVDDVVGGQVLR